MIDSLSPGERWTVFDVVAFTIWSDDRLAAEEVSVARAVAEALALPLGEAGARLRERQPELGELDIDLASPGGRELAYAAAAWAALADGVEHPAERAVLRTLRYRLGVPSDRTLRLESSAYLASLDRAGETARARFLGLVEALQRIHDDPSAPDADSAEVWWASWNGSE